jgi:hypothetical protein
MARQVADSSLSQSEKEDRDVKPINFKPAPSRKHAPRGPKRPDLKKRRIKPDDPDTKSASSRRALWEIASSLGAASYGGSPVKEMIGRQATYHGVHQKGHPTDSTDTPYRSYDRRYFGQKHFDSIVKFAKTLLKEDWLKHGWDGGSSDAPVRAALDIAVHMADGNLYQSKIDAETYDMLLNRLAGWDIDTFSETVLPPSEEPARRSASMSNPVQNIVQIANDIRQKDPVASFEILRNLRSIASGDLPDFLKGGDGGEAPEGKTALGPGMAPPFGSEDEDEDESEDQTAAAPGDTLEFKSMGDDDFKKLKEDAKSKLFEAEDMDSFLKGFDELHKGIKKTGAIQRAAAVEALAVLVRVASANPAVRSALLPIIISAKKKIEKKKGKSAGPDKAKAKAKADKEAEEAATKKGKKGKPEKGKNPFAKGRKASVSFGDSDLDW